MPVTVALARLANYRSPQLESHTASVLETSGLAVRPGERVLVKPNLVNGANARHCTTHPKVARAACAWLLDHGASVTVADSPAFGPASRVALKSGLAAELAELGLRVRSLKRPTPLQLTQGGTIGLSEDALEADRILNLPKLKVHCQMTMSGAVKNLFGCVVGFRKAHAHYSRGHSQALFRSMLIDVYAALPCTHHLMDGIRALHRDGPINGEPFPLGLLGASANGVALDTAAYLAIGLSPEDVPLWAEARARSIPGALPDTVTFPMEAPASFDSTDFVMSGTRELSFRPTRLIKGRIRSFLDHFDV